MGLTVLVVDDDPNTVHLIERSVPWNDYGIEQMYSAYQGVQAMELVEKYMPDIIISDIEMPQMSGLEMMEKLADMDKKPELIFLTCHDNFRYAQQALWYGVSAYLLKPFRLDELSAALLNAVMKCHEKLENEELRKELELKRKQSEKNQDYLVHNFVYRLLNKTMEGNTKTLSLAAARRNISFDVTVRYYLIYVGVNMDNQEMKKVSEAEFYFIFQNLSTEVIYGNTNVASAVENTVHPYYILIMPVLEETGNLEELKERCERLIRVSRQYLNINISCAVSPIVLPEEFGAMKKRMDELFLRERTSASKVMVLEEQDVHTVVEGTLFLQKDVMECLRGRRKKELLEFILKLLKQLDEQHKLDAVHMQAIHHDIMQIFYGFLFENHIQAYLLFQNEVFRELNESAEYSLVNMVKYVGNLYDITFQQIDALRESDSMVERVKKYIEEHFKEDIRREDIAASIFVTPNYLSKVFRLETGMVLREYINICRVEEAKRLLAATDYSVTEIALMVGFENIPYFSTVFKKYCDMTPAAWKNEVGKE